MGHLGGKKRFVWGKTGGDTKSAQRKTEMEGRKDAGKKIGPRQPEHRGLKAHRWLWKEKGTSRLKNDWGKKKKRGSRLKSLTIHSHKLGRN